MKKPLLLAGAVLLAALSGWGVWREWLRPMPVARNVLLITIDTLRFDRVGCFGSKLGITPHIDAFAREAVRFSNAFTPVPLTAPAHSSMLTGRYPVTHGLLNNGTQVLSGDEVLLSEMLHDHGFQTAAIVSALVLSSSFGLDQGFDLYYEKDIKGTKGRTGLWYDQRPGDKTMDRALKWLRAEGDRPFFLWVHLFDPHSPYEPPPPYSETYKKTPYNGEIAFADAQVGRLLDQVRRMGLEDDSIIIIAGDHGEGLGEHNELFHGVFLYNTTTHVPLIVRVPGAREGVAVGDLASPMDITPTVLDALGIPPAAPMQGVSLLPAMRGGRVPGRPLFLESIYASASYGWAAGRALVNLGWKIIDLPTPELYDLEHDPGETKNLYVQDPAKAADLRAEYDQERLGLEATARHAETATIDDETRDRLISLGYIGGQQSTASANEGADPKETAFMITPLNIALKLMKDGKYGDAEQVFRKALEVDPDNRLALLQIARAIAMQERIDEAIPFFEHAVTTYPDVEEFYRTYGRALANAHRLDEAQQVFKRGLESLPESGHLHFMLGYARFLVKDWAGAREELELATGLSPRFGKPYYLLAICKLEAGDEPGALASLEQYLQRDSDVDSVLVDPYFKSLRRKPVFESLISRFL